MEAEPLFLRRCEQIAAILQSDDEADLLTLAVYLRQMLLDRNRLQDTANKGRVRYNFHVGVSRYLRNDPAPGRSFWSILDELDPELGIPGMQTAHLSRDKFLKHVVHSSYGKQITIRDIVHHAANVLGGAHHDPRPEITPIGLINGKVRVKGQEIAIYYLKGIAKVVLRALQPVIDDVRRRQSQIDASAPSTSISARPDRE